MPPARRRPSSSVCIMPDAWARLHLAPKREPFHPFSSLQMQLVKYLTNKFLTERH
jgi:hypothetical protein